MELDHGLRIGCSSERPAADITMADGRAPELIRVRHVNAYAQAMCSMGYDAEGSLERAGIPGGCLVDDTALVPLPYFEQFLSANWSGSELSEFSYHAAPGNLSDYCGLAGQMAGFGTLRHALESGSVGAAEMTNLTIRLASSQRKTWLYAAPLSRGSTGLAWSPYLLRSILALVRAVAGDMWWPDRVLLPCPGAKRLESLDICSHAQVEFGMDAVAIQVPGKILDRTWPSPRAEYTAAADGGEIPNDLVGALRALLKSFSRDRPLQLSTVAQLTGCSARSLQRELHRAGVSYTTLTQEARFLAAVQLLADTDSTVTDVAYELGYSDPAHFSRAFQRNAGASPRALRELGHAMV